MREDREDDQDHERRSGRSGRRMSAPHEVEPAAGRERGRGRGTGVADAGRRHVRTRGSRTP